MNKKEKTLARKVFLLAAELQFLNKIGKTRNRFGHDSNSRYSCDNIGYALHRFKRKDMRFGGTPLHDIYGEYFKPNSAIAYYSGWWNEGDHESRILALLLMVEILKD